MLMVGQMTAAGNETPTTGNPFRALQLALNSRAEGMAAWKKRWLTQNQLILHQLAELPAGRESSAECKCLPRDNLATDEHHDYLASASIVEQLFRRTVKMCGH